MNQEVNMDNKKKRLKLYYGLLVTVLCIIGVSYAWFRLYLSQSENNTLASRTCFSTTLTEDTSKISLTDAFPISDEDGLKQTPFTFTLKNNCDSYVKVYITIDSTYRESSDTTYLKDDYLKVNISSKDTITSQSLVLANQALTDLENNRKGYIIVNTGLKANEEKSYDLRIWMDSSVTTEQGLNKNWSGKIVVVSSASNEPTFAETILANNEVKTPITTPGAAVSTASEALLASAEDDYGTSYYFRGAVKNNYVQFANKCWRIVRVGGDGSVKLILHNDNTAGAANPCDSANNSTSAAFAHFNGTTYLSDFNSNIDDNAYIGFMYGTPGSNDYASTHANINKSIILTNLEAWYTNNLVTYTDKLSDTIWCNDKSTETGASGYGFNETNYSAGSRLRSGKPSLKCSNDNNNGKLSKFTVSDTTNGNGNLTYKIGLLTVDEIMFAGLKNSVQNSFTYLQENANNEWWTMSPCSVSEVTGAYLCSVQIDRLGGGVSNIAVRPSISLKQTTTISGGSGTSEEPYVIN